MKFREEQDASMRAAQILIAYIAARNRKRLAQLEIEEIK